ncbi:DUF805 domain-containing protein [Nitrospirillum sp. BR 11164]|uniref:DUF805 domain-containing protein n=1 Tax=Nitrospirillum sp. BR 11164 TaxID=3104324 RepID=UPI002AFEB5ED|nr:DUF805 domain-containing protein [Nitrospirillum sp. BR 11164]MEA1652308.1 DUF805 domain-containing protein [Nitrospirillum sp. BR 11164]
MEDIIEGVNVSSLRRAPFTWSWFLLSFNGRISRGEFWLKFQIPGLILGALVILLVLSTADSAVFLRGGPGNPFPPAVGALLMVISVASWWPSLAVLVKRCHDRNRSGWFMLVYLIPFVGGLWLCIELGCLRGTPGANRFGADPLS